MNMKKRFDYIDIAKGIAIIYVVLSHISIGFLANHVSSFYMPFFFFLSGLVYDSRKFDNLSNLITKKSNLLKKYFNISILLMIIYLLLGKISKNDLAKVIFGIFYSRYYINKSSTVSMLNISNNALWFLPCLFLVFILYFLICRISKNKLQKIIYSIVLLCIGILLNNLFDFLFPWNFDTSLICIIFFCFGDVFKENVKKLYEKFNLKKEFFYLVVALILNLISINLNGIVNLSIGIYSNYLIFVIGALSGIFMYLIISMIISKYTKKLNKVLNNIGKNSLNIFLYHMLVINLVLMPVCYKFLNKILLYVDPLIYGLLCTTIVISIIMFVDFVKGKVLKFYANQKNNI